MPNEQVNNLITRLTTAQTVDTGRLATSPFKLPATTLLRIRFHYCSATRDADATPELNRIGYQPRRDPGQVAHPPTGGSSSSGNARAGGWWRRG